jgi:SM-20-related protein
MEAKFEELIEGFITGNIGISESFLNLPLATALQLNLLTLDKDLNMAQAGIGNTLIKDDHQKIRSDKTSWLHDDSKNAAEMEFMDTIRQFMEHLNRTCFTGLNACEFHYALYEEGTFYKRHKDQLRNDDNRKFSLISYLNKDWMESDGGQLVIYQDGTEQRILPKNQKTVFFQSDVLEHEVAVAKRARMSVTGWLKRV